MNAARDLKDGGSVLGPTKKPRLERHHVKNDKPMINELNEYVDGHSVDLAVERPPVLLLHPKFRIWKRRINSLQENLDHFPPSRLLGIRVIADPATFARERSLEYQVLEVKLWSGAWHVSFGA
ncbi:MAG TPA: hypothetical protein VLV78_21210 [Thermoanaerobaculia bacterium]|nr:hypothetical protein [Thermoanaerobaculia bacterium]